MSDERALFATRNRCAFCAMDAGDDGLMCNRCAELREQAARSAPLPMLVGELGLRIVGNDVGEQLACLADLSYAWANAMMLARKKEIER